MAKIAKQAGVAKGTLYLYFDSKEALSIAFVKGYFAQMENKLLKQGEAKTLDKFITHLKSTLLIDSEQAQFIPIFFETFGTSFKSKIFRETIASFFDKMGMVYADNIAILIKNKEVRSDVNPQLAGRLLVSTIDGIMLHYGLFSQERVHYENMVNESLVIFVHGLKKNI